MQINPLFLTICFRFIQHNFPFYTHFTCVIRKVLRFTQGFTSVKQIHCFSNPETCGITLTKTEVNAGHFFFKNISQSKKTQYLHLKFFRMIKTLTHNRTLVSFQSTFKWEGINYLSTPILVLG